MFAEQAQSVLQSIKHKKGKPSENFFPFSLINIEIRRRHEASVAPSYLFTES